MTTEKPGKPTLYRPEYDQMAYRLGLLGLIDEELATAFGVTRMTINRWRKQQPSFAKSLEEGKLKADAQVAEALFKRAVGMSITERKVKSVVDETGDEQLAEIIETTTEIPPDVRAASQWLHNRAFKKWKQKIDSPVEINISAIPWDELKQITAAAVQKAEDQHKAIIEGRYERLGIKREYSGD